MARFARKRILFKPSSEVCIIDKRGSLRSQRNLIINTFQCLYLWQTWLASLAKVSNYKHFSLFVFLTNVARFARKRILFKPPSEVCVIDKRGSLRSQRNLIINTFQCLYLWQTWLASLAKVSNYKHFSLFVFLTNVARFARKRILFKPPSEVCIIRSQRNLIINTFQCLYLWQTWLASLAKVSNYKHFSLFVFLTNVARFARKRI